MSNHNDYSIELIKSIEDIENIRNFWQQHQYHIYSDINYYIYTFQNEAQFLQPFILVLNKKNVTNCLIIGRVALRALDWEIGSIKLGSLEVKCLEIGFYGFLGNFSADKSKLMAEFLIQSMKKINVSFIYFDRFNTEAGIFAALQEAAGFMNRDPLILKYRNHKLDLPDSFEDFLKIKSRSTKKNTKYYKNRLHNEFGNDYEIKCYTKKDQIDTAMQEIQSVAVKTYLYAMGKGFDNSKATRQKWLFFANHNMLKAYVLHLQGKPRAFWVFYFYRGVLYSMDTGYDVDFSDYRLGFNLLIYIITESCLDPACQIIDYGLGDETYKQIFGNELATVANFMIFSSTLKGQLYKLIKLISVAPQILAKKTLAHFNLIHYAKKIRKNICLAAKQQRN